MAESPFNPLDKRNLGESVAGALLKRPIGPLSPTNRFVGAGIYAIYYTGRLGSYRPIRERNQDNLFEQPIYVGKAVPKGAMKGGFGLGTSAGNVLFSRMREHARSVEQAEDLELRDFHCRYLVSDDIWIPLGESLLIERFKPLWNVLLQGFGNHPPGRRRQKQNRSMWDTFHPGRPWAGRLSQNPRTPAQLQGMIADFFAGRPVPLVSPEEAVMEEEDQGEE